MKFSEMQSTKPDGFLSMLKLKWKKKRKEKKWEPNTASLGSRPVFSGDPCKPQYCLNDQTCMAMQKLLLCTESNI